MRSPPSPPFGLSRAAAFLATKPRCTSAFLLASSMNSCAMAGCRPRAGSTAEKSGTSINSILPSTSCRSKVIPGMTCRARLASPCQRLPSLRARVPRQTWKGSALCPPPRTTPGAAPWRTGLARIYVRLSSGYLARCTYSPLEARNRHNRRSGDGLLSQPRIFQPQAQLSAHLPACTW